MTNKEVQLHIKSAENLSNTDYNGNNQQEVGDQAIMTKKRLNEIQNSQDLNCYYDGLMYTLSQAYTTALVVSSEQVQTDTGNTGVTIVSKLISFIPFCGGAASGLVDQAWDFIQDAQIKKAANNITKLASSGPEFNDFVMGCVCEAIINKKDEILKLGLKKEEVDRGIIKWADRIKKVFEKLSQGKGRFREKDIWRQI